MIIFYPQASPICVPVIIADMTDSSDQWSTAEILRQVLLNVPLTIFPISPMPLVYSCKYQYEVQHNGVPIDESIKMHLSASIKMPPAKLIAQTSINYFASAASPEALASSFVAAANPQMNIMYAVVVEKTGLISTVCREFVAYSSLLQPDSFGTSATLFIRGASYSDAIVHSALGRQISSLLPLGAQLTAMAASVGYVVVFDPSAAGSAAAPPRCGKLFPPTTIGKAIDEICIQNNLIPFINGQTITIYSQTSSPLVGPMSFLKPEFSFLGYAGALMWAVGIENYANIKFKTAIFNASLFSTITLYDDSVSGLFSGLKQNYALDMFTDPSYDMIVMRYAIIRNDHELVCEVTATNNWLFSQCRVDGILEAKIFGGLAG